ncbi:MAG: hypothetical protein AAFP85_10775 [Pseudomonadota bacterium]
MLSIMVDDWELRIQDGDLPSIFTAYLDHADYVDKIDLDNPEGRFLFFGALNRGQEDGWPSIISAQKYRDERRTFTPGFLVVPNTSLVFVGAGERLLCYDVQNKTRLWEDETTFGFWAWRRFDRYVLMSAEIEFGVWDQHGKKLWTVFVETPWGYEVKNDYVELNVMGTRTIYKLSDGAKVSE